MSFKLQNILSFSFFFAVISVISCGTGGNASGVTQFSAKVGDEKFKAKSALYFKRGDKLHIKAETKDGKSITMSMGGELKEKEYDLEEPQNSTSYSNKESMFGSQSGTITITDYNEGGNISGKFKFTAFSLDNGKVNVTDGKFKNLEMKKK